MQEYDLYNIITGYYPLRLCQTAEEEMKRNTINEVEQIKKTFKANGYGWLNKHIVPKCETTGFCPEEETCMQIKKKVKNYSLDFHKKMSASLKKKAGICA